MDKQYIIAVNIIFVLLSEHTSILCCQVFARTCSLEGRLGKENAFAKLTIVLVGMNNGKQNKHLQLSAVIS